MRASGATVLLNAAFCRLAKSLSYSEHMRGLVGAVGIERTAILTKRCALMTLRRTRSFPSLRLLRWI
jgi:hypothetical protein